MVYTRTLPRGDPRGVGKPRAATAVLTRGRDLVGASNAAFSLSMYVFRLAFVYSVRVGDLGCEYLRVRYVCFLRLLISNNAARHTFTLQVQRTSPHAPAPVRV